MYFTSNGIGKKNGFRFEIRFSSWLDGQEAENKYYLFCSRPKGKALYEDYVYTERSLRFPTADAAKAFCEKIASGEVTLDQLKQAEEQAQQAHKDKEYREAEQLTNAFLSKLKDWGVSPVLVPDIFRGYRDLNEKATELFFEHIEKLKQALQPENAEPKMTLAKYLDGYRNDIDVCLEDKDTGEHLLNAICYLSEEDLQDPDYFYEDWENWILSLPLDHTVDINGCIMAVVKTDYSWDETCFLLGQNEFESNQWEGLYLRSRWAGAEFADRLAYLTEGKSFEHPFDGNCMKPLGAENRETLLRMLSDSENVFIASYPNHEDELYAYTYHFDEKGYPVIDDDADIKLTEPGRGLVSTLEGKVCWAEHVAKKVRSEADSHIRKAKDNGKEL